MRKIYEYLSIEEKKEAVEKLREDLRKLKKKSIKIKILFLVSSLKYCIVHEINGI